MRPVLVGFVLLVSSVGVPAQPVTQRFTDLVGTACQWDRERPGAVDESTKRCPGPAGTTVVINPWHSFNFIGFTWRGRGAVTEVVRGPGLGTKLEWRGRQTERGFEPHAALIRVLFRKEASQTVERQVLAVMKIRPGDACAVAFVDMTANPRPYELAQEAADRRAPDFVCGRDTPAALGVATARTKELLEQKPLAR